MEAAIELANSAGPRFVGPLIELLVAQTAGFGSLDLNMIYTALIELLPRLQASDSHYLSEEQRSALNRMLTNRLGLSKSQAISLRIAILKAYEQVGDTNALPVVQRLAEGAGPGKDRSIREAAQQCLPYLQQRADQESASRQLLRAADATGTTPESLLRPATESSDTTPEQLLRADNPSAPTSH